MLKRFREVLGGAVGSRYAVNASSHGSSSVGGGRGDTEWGERLYAAGRHLMQRRLELWRSSKAQAAEGEASPEDWVCPKCSHTNALAAATCQRVTGRATSLLDAAPHEWARVPVDATQLRGRRLLADDGALYRCGQARPRLFTPTIVSLQEYSAVYAQPLPLAVRLRPENVFDELYARRLPQEEKLRALQLQRCVRVFICVRAWLRGFHVLRWGGTL